MIVRRCITPDVKWVKLWEIVGQHGNPYVFASRRTDPSSPRTHPDAVVIVPVLDGKLVLLSEYRPVLDGREISFPAGLVDKNETLERAAARELLEETGLTIKKIHMVSPNVYSSSGLTDEAVAFVFCEVTGTPTSANQESSEDINVMLLDAKQTMDLAFNRDAFHDAVIGAKTWPFLLVWEELFKKKEA